MRTAIIALVMMTCGCQSTRVDLSEFQHEDFIVPVHRMDWAITQFGGSIAAGSEQFRAWLDRNGLAGKLCALHDDRYFDFACIGSFGQGVMQFQEYAEHDEMYKNQVRDVCYQIISEEFKSAPHLSYRDPRDVRDQKIDTLIKFIIAQDSPAQLQQVYQYDEGFEDQERKNIP